MDVRRTSWRLSAGVGLLFWFQVLVGLTGDSTDLQVAWPYWGTSDRERTGSR